jgi:hypothetical protein
MAKHGVAGIKEQPKQQEKIIYYPEVGNPKVPELEEFVKKYLPDRLEMNWHHQFFYDILSNKVVQKSDGLFYLNDEEKINKEIVTVAPRFPARS